MSENQQIDIDFTENVDEEQWKYYHVERGVDLVMQVNARWLKFPSVTRRGNSWICGICGKPSPDADEHPYTEEFTSSVPLILFVGSPQPDRQLDFHFECAMNEGLINDR